MRNVYGGFVVFWATARVRPYDLTNNAEYLNNRIVL
jgi:hypothetical protein